MNFLRKHQRVILMIVIAGFFISTFVGFGLYLGSGASHADTAAEVNGEKIPMEQFNTLYNQLVTRKRDNNEVLNTEGLARIKQEVVQALIQESVFYQEALKYGFRVSDLELAQNLASIPAFQKEGKFNPGAYVNMLQTVLRTSPKQFEESQRRQITINHLRNFIMRSVKVTDKEVDMAFYLKNAMRDPKKKEPPLDREAVRKQLTDDKISHILNLWYQRLGSNIKIKVYLDENKAPA